MIDSNPLITVSIVLLLAIIWRLWGRKKPRNKIEPKAPWDGVHRLEHLRYFEYYGNSPDDFNTGWIWKCTCGIGNSHNYWRLPHTEELGMAEFKKHLQIHKGECNCFGS